MGAITTMSADIKERISFAYLTAVAARAGCEVHSTIVDRNGIDATIKPIQGASVSIDVQMKSVSRNIRIDGGRKLSYQLDAPTYNKLRRTDAQAPQLLVILEMPPDDIHWLSVPPPLIIREAAYWCILRGEPPIETATTAVHLSEDQVFDHRAITAIIEHAHARAIEGQTWG